MASVKTKTQAKRPHIECDSDNDEPYPRFIILESKEKLPLTKLSPFIIEKSISALITPKTVKNLKNGTILIEVTGKKQAEIILKQKKIHNIDIKVYPHERLNTSKGVIRNGELSLCSITEIKNELKKQNVIDVKRITIKKQNEIIETNTYVLTFNNPKPPLEMKIGYTVVKVEIYIPNPRRCHNCQKYGHLKEHCTRKQVCVKCGEQEPNHIEESCKNSLNCNNCKGNYRADSKYCKIWEREKEIIKMKITKNITFPEARRLIENPFNKLTFSQVTRTPSNQVENEAKTQIKTIKIEEGLTNLINDLHELIKTLKTIIPNVQLTPTDKSKNIPSTSSQKNETLTIKNRNRSTSRTREKEEKQKPTQHTPTKTKNKSRNIESMETEMDSTPKIENTKIK